MGPTLRANQVFLCSRAAPPTLLNHAIQQVPLMILCLVFLIVCFFILFLFIKESLRILKKGKSERILWCWTWIGSPNVNTWFSVYRYKNKYKYVYMYTNILTNRIKNHTYILPLEKVWIRVFLLFTCWALYLVEH